MTVKRVVNPPKSSTMPGRSVAAFKNAFDKSIVIPAKIEAALARIGAEYRTVTEFQKEAGVNPMDLALFRDQYQDYIVVVRIDGKPKDIWFGTVIAAEDARASVS